MINPSLWILLLSVAMLCLGHGLSGSLVSLDGQPGGIPHRRHRLRHGGLFGGAARLRLPHAAPGAQRRPCAHLRRAGLHRLHRGAAVPAVGRSDLLVRCCGVISGLCVSGMFIVCESWLNAVSSNRNRGQMLSLYMIVTYGALGLGQLLLNVTDDSGFVRFIIVSCLLSMALVPLILLPSEAPSVEGARSVTVDEIWRASPLAVVGVLACGLGQSAFFALGVVFGLAKGLPLVSVSIMMALPPLGVILSQYPIGWISDRFDRRTIIMLLSFHRAVICGDHAGRRLLPVARPAHLAGHRLRRHLAADLFAGRRPCQ